MAVSVAIYDDLKDREPAYALVGEVDLVVVRFDEDVRVYYAKLTSKASENLTLRGKFEFEDGDTEDFATLIISARTDF